MCVSLSEDPPTPGAKILAAALDDVVTGSEQAHPLDWADRASARQAVVVEKKFLY